MKITVSVWYMDGKLEEGIQVKGVRPENHVLILFHKPAKTADSVTTKDRCIPLANIREYSVTRYYETGGQRVTPLNRNVDWA